MPEFEGCEAGMTARAVKMRAALEFFVQKTLVEGAFPGRAKRSDVDFPVQMAAYGRAVTGNANAASVPCRRRARDLL